MLAIGELLHRRPRQLSGGQRQRVAMGRSIVREPQAFLMDEPLSNLDAKLRVEMRASIARLHQQLRTTTIYVTHDQTEAMTMGDRVAVMKDGRLEQVDTPRELYERPANLFVGAFIGSPALNVVRATVAAENGGVVASFGTASLSVPERHPAAGPLRRRAGGDVVLGIRPEDIEDGGLTESSDERVLRRRRLSRRADRRGRRRALRGARRGRTGRRAAARSRRPPQSAQQRGERRAAPVRRRSRPPLLLRSGHARVARVGAAASARRDDA